MRNTLIHIFFKFLLLSNFIHKSFLSCYISEFEFVTSSDINLLKEITCKTWGKGGGGDKEKIN